MGACECAADQLNTRSTQISSLDLGENIKFIEDHSTINSKNQSSSIQQNLIVGTPEPPAIPSQLELALLHQFQEKKKMYQMEMQMEESSIQEKKIKDKHEEEGEEGKRGEECQKGEEYQKGEGEGDDLKIIKSGGKLGLKQTHELKKIISKVKQIIDELNLPSGYVHWPQDIQDKISKFQKITQNIEKTTYKYVHQSCPASTITYLFASDMSFHQSISNHGSIVFYLHPTKDYYYGETRYGKAHGEGEYVHYEGTKYKGSWKMDQMHGRGKEEWIDGAWFEGFMKNGVKVWGTFHYPNGAFYQGEFHKGKFQGIGKYSYPKESGLGVDTKNVKNKSNHSNSDNNKENLSEFKSNREKKQKDSLKTSAASPLCRYYVGHFSESMMNGTGVFYWPSFQHFCGNYLNDKKDGDGVLRLDDGTILRGKWKQGKIYGKVAVWKDEIYKYLQGNKLLKQLKEVI